MSPIVSARSHRPTLRALDGYGQAGKPATDIAATTEHRKSALRVVTDEPHEAGPVLLAGADPARRAVLRAEFGATLPRRIPFAEAHDVSDVLERARSSRMVILAGDLDDADADSLMRLLGRRHPQLPVICVEEPMPAAAGGRC
jgi:hypothetical protein